MTTRPYAILARSEPYAILARSEVDPRVNRVVRLGVGSSLLTNRALSSRACAQLYGSAVRGPNGIPAAGSIGSATPSKGFKQRHCPALYNPHFSRQPQRRVREIRSKNLRNDYLKRETRTERSDVAAWPRFLPKLGGFLGRRAVAPYGVLLLCDWQPTRSGSRGECCVGCTAIRISETHRTVVGAMRRAVG